MDIAALKRSWATVVESGDEVPLFFYSHLFLTRPELRQLFPISMSAQRDKLVSALGSVVSNLDELDNAVPLLQQLGRDHRRFMVEPEHYDAVGASLLATLQHFLGSGWTKELAESWTTAYGVVAKTMIQAAEQDGQHSPAWWNANVVRVERRTFDMVVLQLRPEQPYPFRPGQSFAMEVPQRPRLWRYFSPANAPRQDGTIELHVQAVDGGQVSTAIVRSLRVGDTVRIGAPVGEALVWDEGNPGELLLVAGGTGLAPLRAVLEQLDRAYRAGQEVPDTYLFHGARMPWGLYESNTLRALAERPWFSYAEVVSDDQAHTGHRGLVGDVAARSGLWQGRTCLVCGSAAMVNHTVSRLREAGADAVRYEKFAGTEGVQ